VKSPLRTDARRGFGDLIVVLNELSTNGNSTPRFSTVFSLWRERKPDAFETVGAAQFKTYLQLAESTRIVTIEQQQDGDGRVTLRHPWNTNPDNPPRQTPQQHIGSQFRDLIRILDDLRLAGDFEPQFFTVGPRLLRKDPSIYEDADVIKFEEYVEAAVEAGVVTVRRMRDGDGRLKLHPDYCDPTACSPTPTRATSTPPTLAASAVSPFAPLVEFLKSKQMTGGQPVSSPDVFAHFVSTLGYPGLVSLCTSIPGVTTFGQYIDSAIASGLVSLGGGTTTSGAVLAVLHLELPDSLLPPVQSGVSITPPPSHPFPQETAVSPPPVKVTPSSFWDLAAVLTELRASTGESVFRFSKVVPPLLRRRPNAYASVGVARFMDYVTLAMENGIVEAGGMDQGDGWVSLSDLVPGGPAVSLQPSKLPGDGMVTTPPPFPRWIRATEGRGEEGEDAQRLRRQQIQDLRRAREGHGNRQDPLWVARGGE